MTNTTQATVPKNEKKAQLLWTGFILMFFGIQAVIWSFAISITSRDSSHAVVAGYDEQALNWDEVKELQQASHLLGWQYDISVDATGDIFGNRVVTLHLNDKDGTPLDDANIKLSVFHCAIAADVQTPELAKIAAGIYSGKLKVSRPGKWRITGQATRAGQRFMFDQTLFITTDKVSHDGPPSQRREERISTSTPLQKHDFVGFQNSAVSQGH